MSSAGSSSCGSSIIGALSASPLAAGAAALLATLVLCGLAYVFQPAAAAFQQARIPRPRYTYPVYKPKSNGKAAAGADKEEEAAFPCLLAEEEGKQQQQQQQQQSPEVQLSLVIPAYNEEARLPVMLDATLAYLEQWQGRDKSLTYELIVVDDGSKDSTVDVALAYSRRLGSDTLRLLRLPRNRGKGGALREGMLHTRGAYALMVDADGATDISCLERLYKETAAAEAPTALGPVAVGVGSRAHYEKDSVAQRAWYRTILMKGLHVLVSVLISARIRDTQCGFKLFTRAAVRVLFGTLHLERWGFDLEIVHLCDRLGLPMVEVPVNWREVEGSKLIQNKLDVVFASLGIFRDMLCVRLCYLLGLWRTGPYTRRGLGAATSGSSSSSGGGGGTSGSSPLRRSPRRRGKAD